MSVATIWDGLEFQHVEPAVAKALVDADKAQIIDGTVDGPSLKYRHEFTGYSTGPLKAGAVHTATAVEVEPQPDSPDQQPDEPEAQLDEPETQPDEPDSKPEQEAPEPQADPAPAEPEDLMAYRKAASQHFGIAYNKTKKDDIRRYLAETAK